MQAFTTPVWGYKIISPSVVNFYHILLTKVQAEVLKLEIPYIESISQHQDKSITISVKFPSYLLFVVQSLVAFLEKRSSSFLETPNYYYKITSHDRQIIAKWSFAFLGCLSLMLRKDLMISALVEQKWELINSYAGGIYIEPFTLLLYSDYPKIIHPVTMRNYKTRETIEKTTAEFVQELCDQARKSQDHLVGIGMMSLVQEKTNLSPNAIALVINEKSLNIKTPKFAPIFTS